MEPITFETFLPIIEPIIEKGKIALIIIFGIALIIGILIILFQKGKK